MNRAVVTLNFLLVVGFFVSSVIAIDELNLKPLQRAEIPAFPGAEGAGAWTVGGRGGKVLIVNNLNDSGPGSLREAVSTKGARIVVFQVAGIIRLESPLNIDEPYLTLAGQTAPGDGICIRGETTAINTHDVIIRYVRFRRGNFKRRDDALGGNPIGNIIVDHVSTSWGLDENMSMYRHMAEQPNGPAIKQPAQNITIQWSISSEALNIFNHAFGGTWGGKECSFHHNLFACNTGRNPSIGMGGGFDFRNNVVFNWEHRTMDGGDGSSRVNVINNYYRAGPATPEGDLRHRICRAQARNERDQYPGFGKWFVSGNIVHGFPEITKNNWLGGVQYDPETKQKDMIIPAGSEEKVRVFEAFASAPVTTHHADEAFELVLRLAGATLPKRDPVDQRVAESVRSGQVSFKNGIIESPEDVGGYPEYKAQESIVDSDLDGMPDAWEEKYQFNARDSKDGGEDTDRDGYTNIEEYLNGTDPKVFVNYKEAVNNQNRFH